jgi:hypothetical protein
MMVRIRVIGVDVVLPADGQAEFELDVTPRVTSGGATVAVELLGHSPITR